VFLFIFFILVFVSFGEHRTHDRSSVGRLWRSKVTTDDKRPADWREDQEESSSSGPLDLKEETCAPRRPS